MTQQNPQLTADLLQNANLEYVSRDHLYTYDEYWPLFPLRYSSESYISTNSYTIRALQEMLCRVQRNEDPFDYFCIKVNDNTYRIQDLINYYLTHPRAFGFVGRKTSTARANNIGKSIGLGEVLNTLKVKITHLLLEFNKLFIPTIYTDNRYWSTQRSHYISWVNSYEREIFSTHEPIFKAEKDLGNIVHQLELDGCSDFANSLLDNIMCLNGVDTNNYSHYSLINYTPQGDESYNNDLREKLREKANGVVLPFLRQYIYTKLEVFTALLIDIFINTLVIGGGLRNQRKERNRLSSPKNFKRMVEMKAFPEVNRHSSQLALLVSLFAGFTINKNEILIGIKGIYSKISSSFSMPKKNSLTDISSIIVEKLQSSQWKSMILELRKDFSEVENFLEIIEDIENYLYGKFFRGTDLESKVQELNVDTTVPIYRIFPAFASTVFTGFKYEDLSKLLFEKLVMTPMSFNAGTSRWSYNEESVEFSFSHQETLRYILNEIQSVNSSDNNRDLAKILLTNKDDWKESSKYLENLMASSLDNKRLVFSLNRSRDIYTSKTVVSGLYNQDVTTKEALGILLMYLLFALNHNSLTANDSGYCAYAPKCPTDVTIYTEDY